MKWMLIYLLFIVTDTDSKLPESLTTRNVTRLSNDRSDLEIFFDFVSPDWRNATAGNYLGGLPGHDTGHGAYQLRDRWFCEQMIKSQERTQALEYESVGVGRADLLWLLPHPAVNFTGCWIPCKENDWGGVCDHWAWCDRRSAFKYLTAPLQNLAMSSRSVNTEQHLKFSLENEKVEITRGKAAFIRLCTGLKSCAPVLNVTNIPLSAKVSGKQIEIAKAKLFEETVKLVISS